MKLKKYKAVIITFAVLILLYILFCFIVIHVALVRQEVPGMEMYESIAAGIKDAFAQPFAVFPLPRITGLLVIAPIFLIFGIWVVNLGNKNRQHNNPETVLGGSRLDGKEQLDDYNRKFTEPFGSVKTDSMNNIIFSQDFYLSINDRAIGRNLHIVVIGGSGSGKSFRFVGPNLMQANSSYVVTDPSGELFMQYGYFFEYIGYKVKCFNLDHMELSNHYNPFVYLTSDKDVSVLVKTLMLNTTPPDAHAGDPFWEKSEQLLLTALVAYLNTFVLKKEDRNFSNVMELLLMARVDENDSTVQSKLDLAFEKMREQKPDAFALAQYDTFKMGAGKTLKSILISVGVRMQAFELEDVKQLTNTDDIDLDSIGDEKTALFICIPSGDEAEAFNFLASLMYSQLFQRLEHYSKNYARFSQLLVDKHGNVIHTFRARNQHESDEARKQAEEFLAEIRDIGDDGIIKINRPLIHPKNGYDGSLYEIRTKSGKLVAWRGTKELAKEALNDIKHGGVRSNAGKGDDLPEGVARDDHGNGSRLPIHTRFILDEFANIGKIPAFEQKVATIRKFEMSVNIILQSLKQLQDMYDKNWSSIIGNCDNTLYLGGGADLETFEWVTKLLGKETRVVMSTTYQAFGQGSSSYNRQGVELLPPDEIRTLDENNALVIPKSRNAFMGPKYDTLHHKNWHLVADTPDFVWDSRRSAQLLKDYRLINEVKKPEPEPEITESKEQEAQRKASNEAAIQAEKECKANMDVNGNTLIEDPREIRVEKEELAKEMKIEKKEDIKPVEESIMETMDNDWGIEEMEMGESFGRF